jgi:hypothetical protein
MGIANHAFPLALINPDLRFVDPFASDLTKEQIIAITEECKINPWYFFREVARVPAQAGSEACRVEANRANIAMWWCFFNHMRIMLIQPRQTGKSLCTDFLTVLLMNVMCTDTLINLVTKDDGLRAENVSRLKEIRFELPDYLQHFSKKDPNNSETVGVGALNNRLKVHVPQPDKKRATNLGRGSSSPVLLHDEGPFQVNVGISLPAALAARGAMVDKAKAVGAPHGVVMTTTAGKKDEPSGAYIYQLMEEAAVWTEKFFDCKDYDALYEMVTSMSSVGDYAVTAVFNHRQLGKTDAWLEEKIREAKQKGGDADRDFRCQWTSGSNESPFTPQDAELIRNSQREVLHVGLYPGKHAISWYIPKEQIDTTMRTRDTIVSIDPSDAGGGDDLSLVITDTETGMVLGAGAYNSANLFQLTKWLVSMLIEWERSYWIIERRSQGASIIDAMLTILPEHGINPLTRLFNRILNEPELHPQEAAMLSRKVREIPEDFWNRNKRFFGFSTSGGGVTSRSDLYSLTLATAIELGGDRINHKKLIDQLLGLTIKNGRVDHGEGNHDDLVIAWLLSYWWITKGANLSSYGFQSKQILAKCRVSMRTDESFVDQKRRAEQLQIRADIEQTYLMLKKETDDMIAMRLEAKLKFLDSKLILEDNDVYSFDALMAEVKQQRQANRIRNKTTNTARSYNGRVGGLYGRSETFH